MNDPAPGYAPATSATVPPHHASGTAVLDGSDAYLLTLARTGSDDAFARLYERHLRAARAAARALARSDAAADDLVSDGFARVLAALRNGGGPTIAFRPYLLASIRNVWHDRHRKDHRVTTTSDVPDAPSIVEPNALNDERQIVARAFAQLPDRWQAVLWHTEVEDMAPAEVAAILGVSPNALAALRYRAKEGLRQAYLQAHLGPSVPTGCADVRTRLGAYVRESCPDGETKRIEDHLAGCAPCRAVLEELREIDTGLPAGLVPLVVGGSAGTYLAGLGATSVGIGIAVPTGVTAMGAGVLASSFVKFGLAASLLVGTAAVAMDSSPAPADHVVVAAAPTDADPDRAADPVTGGDTGGPLVPLPGPGGGPDGDPSAPPSTTPAAPGPGGGGGPPGADPSGPAPAPATPGATPPVATTPSATVPGVSVPPISVPPISVPPISVPPVSVPPITVPEVSLPPIAVPPVSLPPVTVPVVSVPPITVPAISVPPVTVPGLPLPPVTVPVVSVPPITVPPVSLPPVTVPPVTLPPVTVPPISLPPVTVPPVTLPPVTLPPVTLPPLPPLLGG